MKIAILGSTGFVGKVLINKALTTGCQVKTLARYPEKLEDIKQILVAKHLEWEVLKKSNLDRTLIQPPRIANEPASGNISADEKVLNSLKLVLKI